MSFEPGCVAPGLFFEMIWVLGGGCPHLCLQKAPKQIALTSASDPQSGALARISFVWTQSRKRAFESTDLWIQSAIIAIESTQNRDNVD